MSDPLADSLERLKRLVDQIMIEGDPAKYDEFACEIWRVLDERRVLQTVTKEVTSTARGIPPRSSPSQ